MAADLFPAVVNWVVIFEPLVKKIGCDDRKMWDAYLLVRDRGNLFCISKQVARPCKKWWNVVSRLSWTTHSLKWRYVFETEDETLPSVLAHAKMYPRNMPRENCHAVWADSYHLLSVCCIIESHSFCSWRFSVNVRINSVRLPLVTHNFRLTCNRIVVNQYSVMQGEENQFVLYFILHHQSIPSPSSLKEFEYQGELDYSNLIILTNMALKLTRSEMKVFPSERAPSDSGILGGSNEIWPAFIHVFHG